MGIYDGLMNAGQQQLLSNRSGLAGLYGGLGQSALGSYKAHQKDMETAFYASNKSKEKSFRDELQKETDEWLDIK